MCQQDSAIFEEFSSLIALDMSVSIRGPDDMEALFSALAELETFRKKSSTVKSGRWFSWHNAAADHLPEWWSTRLLLKFLNPEEISPDERKPKDFNDLRKADAQGPGAGGLRLALRCLSWQNWFSISALQLGGKPLYKFHSKNIKQIKHPKDGLLRNQDLAWKKWMRDEQLIGLVKVFHDSEAFSKILEYHQECVFHLDSKADEALAAFEEDIFWYTLNLLGKRGCSLCAHGSPPECYAGVLSDREDTAQDGLDFLNADWNTVVLLEQSSNQGCSDLALDLGLTISMPMRLVFQLFEAGRTQEGIRLLTSLLKRLPDTKAIEDVHQRLRTTSNSNPNSHLGLRELQSLVETSGVLEERRVENRACLDKESFKSRWRSSKADPCKDVFLSGTEVLPESFAGILARKTWATMSEENLSRSSAAWEWARAYMDHRLKSYGHSVQDSNAVFI